MNNCFPPICSFQPIDIENKQLNQAKLKERITGLKINLHTQLQGEVLDVYFLEKGVSI